jgi:plasmid stability protein
MGQVIVRDLDDRVVAAWKARAARRGRSLEAELGVILERAAAGRVVDVLEARAPAERLRAGARPCADSDGIRRRMPPARG